MHADKEFADACHPDIAVILGVRIEAYHVGHKLLLQRLRNPFGVGGMVGIKALLEAVLICSRPYAESARGLYRSSRWQRARAWLWSTWYSLRVRFDPTLLPAHAAAFEDYIVQSEAGSKNIFIKDSVPRAQVPLIPLYLEELCAGYNLTPEQVLELPFKQATMMRLQLLAKPESGIKWREGWMTPAPSDEVDGERAHAE